MEYVICLQRELSPEQRALVLRHELEHIRLGHLWFKGWANMGVFLYWWDPLIWLGYKYFCRDLELACDAAVLKELEPEERREYARTLVEMGGPGGACGARHCASGSAIQRCGSRQRPARSEQGEPGGASPG